MKKDTYTNFVNDIKQVLNEFLLKYDVPFDYFCPQNENDDVRYMINLGEKYGKVNILFESFINLPENEKNSNTFTIPMRFWDCNENHKKVFKFDCGQLNDEDGIFILFSKENGLESLKNDFKGILNEWSKEQKERKMELPLWRLCLN